MSQHIQRGNYRILVCSGLRCMPQQLAPSRRRRGVHFADDGTAHVDHLDDLEAPLPAVVTMEYMEGFQTFC